MKIQHKFFLILLSSVLLINTITSIFFFYQTRYLSIEAALSGLRNETRILTKAFNYIHNTILDDIAIIEKTSPVKNLIKAMENNNIDPEDNSNFRDLKNRMEEIFTFILNQRSYYDHIRYIEASTEGKELVRVNKNGDFIQIVEEKDLQSKSNEPYFKFGLNLEPSEYTFYEVSYNREHGQIEKDLQITLRGLHPVYKDSNQLGMLVINVDYPKLIEHFLRNSDVKDDLILLNEFGDYVIYDHKSKSINFQMHDNYTTTPPEYLSSINTSLGHEDFYEDSEILIYFKSSDINFKRENKRFALGLKVQKKNLLERSRHLQICTIIWVVLVILLGLLLSTYLFKILFPLNDTQIPNKKTQEQSDKQE